MLLVLVNYTHMTCLYAGPDIFNDFKLKSYISKALKNLQKIQTIEFDIFLSHRFIYNIVMMLFVNLKDFDV